VPGDHELGDVLSGQGEGEVDDLDRLDRPDHGREPFGRGDFQEPRLEGRSLVGLEEDVDEEDVIHRTKRFGQPIAADRKQGIGQDLDVDLGRGSRLGLETCEGGPERPE
jgi:hypothetical protein